MNAGIGAMGPYNHPNTAIGCAYSLLSRNGGGPRFLPPSAPPSILPRISNKPDAVYAPRMRGRICCRLTCGGKGQRLRN